ncbi:ABC transporter substrate-binding protein [Paenibacillus hodogayensis]|uniref:ABC transporter substrate-binding protein n=1 Tax=Paenibacillus hodogayensis TaxID=279208 RepID=A0ABV5VW17_9BACL
MKIPLKTIALWMTAALALSVLLAGCSGGSSTAPAAQPEQGATAPAALPKVYFYSNNGTLMGTSPQGSDPQKLKKMQELVRQKVGIDPIAIIPPKGADKDKLNLLLSSSESIDTFLGSWDEYAPKNMIVPLNELLDKYGQNLKKVFTPEEWRSVTDKDGKIWGIPGSRAYVAYPIYVRGDWLKKLGLQMPKNLDELEAVLKAFKERDPDGNGKADTIPLATDLSGLRYAILGGFIDNESGYSNYLDPADKKLKPIELHPGYKDFLAKMADWYKNGYIDKEAFTKDDAPELLKTNRVGVTAKWYSRVTLNQPKLTPSFPEMDHQIAKGITGPKGKLQTSTAFSSYAILISRKAANPEAVIKFYDWNYADISNWMTAIRGVEGEDWKWTDRSKLVYELTKSDQPYGSEFAMANLVDLNNNVSTFSPETAMMTDYFNTEMFKFENAKRPLDSGFIYDRKELAEKVPNAGDITRLINEETVKFIMGARPLAEYDKFVDELQKAGLGKWIDEMTRQYNGFVAKK